MEEYITMLEAKERLDICLLSLSFYVVVMVAAAAAAASDAGSCGRCLVTAFTGKQVEWFLDI